jgi:Family of unknown function (DUF6111)
MGRFLIQVVVPIVLPSALYALWLVAERRRQEAAGTGQPPRWAEVPWVWLLALGVILAGTIAVAIALFGGDSIQGVYVPPQVQDGRIVPGHVVPPGR